MEEVWKDIVGYEGLYQVSNLGRVKTINYRAIGKTKIRKLSTDKDGYKSIKLYKDRKQKGYQVHRLMAEAFIDNPNNYPQVNHKDECKYNNCVDNLEWCTAKYNMTYGTRSKKIRCINTGEEFKSSRDVERKYNIHHSDIIRCCKDKRKSAGKHPVTGEKLRWEYVE